MEANRYRFPEDFGMSKAAQFSPRHLLTSLRSSLEVLHEPAEQQLRYLASLGLPEGIDELALEFDDLAPTIVQLAESQVITPEGVESVRRLDEALSAMSGPDNDGLWTPWALRTAPDWNDIRTLAGRALVHIDQSQRSLSVESS
jgi:hypothetical protein